MQMAPLQARNKTDRGRNWSAMLEAILTARRETPGTFLAAALMDVRKQEDNASCSRPHPCHIFSPCHQLTNGQPRSFMSEVGSGQFWGRMDSLLGHDTVLCIAIRKSRRDFSLSGNSVATGPPMWHSSLQVETSFCASLSFVHFTT